MPKCTKTYVACAVRWPIYTADAVGFVAHFYFMDLMLRLTIKGITIDSFHSGFFIPMCILLRPCTLRCYLIVYVGLIFYLNISY